MDFLVNNWPELVAAAVALLGLLNAYVTAHPDQVSNPVARVLLIALDVISWLQSRDARPAVGAPRGLRPKLPLVQRSADAHPLSTRPRTGTIREGVTTLGLWVIGALLLASVVAQAGCSSWADTTRRIAHASGRVAALAPPAIRERCLDKAHECRKDGVRCTGLSDLHCAQLCPPLAKCHKVELELRRGNLAAQLLVERTLAAVELGDKPKAEQLLAEAIKTVQALRLALKPYGVELP